MLANGKRTADWHPVQAKDDKGDYFLVRAFDSTSAPGWSRCAGTGSRGPHAASSLKMNLRKRFLQGTNRIIKGVI
jgi:hypothetical protein